MKKLITVYALALVIFLIPAATAFADCPDMQFNCYTKNKVKVGSDSVRMCWKWSKVTCWPCFCDSSDSKYCMGGYEAGWCNTKFPSECNGNCCACVDGTCRDKDGNFCFYE